MQPLPGPPIPASERLRAGAERLGWDHGEIPRWMAYAGADAGSGPAPQHDRDVPASGDGRRRPPRRRPARRPPRRRSPPRRGRRHRRRASRPRRRHDARITFGSVIVCGGAIQTPALLQRSGLGAPVGATLAAHPTVKLAARFDDEVNVPDDVPVHQVSEFAPDLSFGGSASSPGLVALALSDHWSLFGEAVEAWRQIAVYYAAITSEGRGRVVAVPGWRDPVVTYHLTRRDRELLGSGLARLALVLLEAGATAVYPSYRGAPIVRSRRDLAALQGTFRPQRASLMTVHLCSTVPMGGDARRFAGRRLRTAPRHHQRLRQRRLAAARRSRRQPAGVGDGHRHPQRPALPRRSRRTRRPMRELRDPPDARPSSPGATGGSVGRCSPPSPTPPAPIAAVDPGAGDVAAAAAELAGTARRRAGDRRRSHVGRARRPVRRTARGAGDRRDPRRRCDPSADAVGLGRGQRPRHRQRRRHGHAPSACGDSSTSRRTARSAPTPPSTTSSATTSRTTRTSATAARRCSPSCACSTRSPTGSTP